MKNFLKFYIQNNSYLFVCLLVIFLQIVFFISSYDNYFHSDDFQQIIGVKLYNLIQGSNLSIKDLFFSFGPGAHYAPLYYFFIQYFPDNFVFYHLITVIFHTISSILVFLILKRLISDNPIAILATLIYTYNFSVHIKPLIWNCWNVHIINSTFGFLSVLILIEIFKRANPSKWLYFLYLCSSCIAVFNYETGLIYIVISFFIILLFSEKKKIINLFFSLIPSILYFLTVVYLSGEIHPLLKERTSENFSQEFETKINLNDDNYFYYYRSSYAPRDKLGYSLRAADNFLASTNLSSIENIVKYFFGKNKNEVKDFFVKKFNYIAIFLILFFTLAFLYLLKLFKRTKNKIFFLKFLTIYFVLFFIFTFIYMRKDLNVAQAFPASVIISVIIIELYRINRKLISISIAFVYFFISLAYLSTGFEYINEFSKRSSIKQIWYKHYNLAQEMEINEKISDYDDYKHLYYFLNFNKYEQELKNKYKGEDLKNFFVVLK